jgi:hypothetical protein
MASMSRVIYRWAILVGLLGALAGMFWVYVVAAAMNLYTTLTPGWTAAMYVTCPVIRIINWGWWLVPLLNGAFYALVLTGVRTLLRQRISI